ncbi:phage head completion protein [Sphingomonas quercus]|uniref:Head-tail adaptor protein n=1 Tax=Sphingomonas quercus TaxID=2842451 RepID=A0ABS6BM57_9SPHN|nr:head-tail adaptor protein [Sphingomonas quercus]MBU3078471.1 head-tail adaptor protein [Sphingomonas quercus]
MSAELAGTMRERVTILRRAPGRDSLGGAAGEWLEIGAAWAAIAPGEGGAVVAGNAVAAMPLWRATLRLPTPATVDDRLLWRGRRLTVRRMTADPRSPDRIEFLAEEER